MAHTCSVYALRLLGPFSRKVRQWPCPKVPELWLLASKISSLEQLIPLEILPTTSISSIDSRTVLKTEHPPISTLHT